MGFSLNSFAKAIALITVSAAALVSCSTTSNIEVKEGSVSLDILQDVKMQTGTGAPKSIKAGEVVNVSEPVVLMADGYYPMTVVPADSGRTKLQIKLVKQVIAETGDPQKNTNMLLGDVLRVQSLIAKGKGSEAITIIEQSQKSWPRVSFLDYLKASALVVSRDYDRALTIIDDALTQDPESKELKELKAQLKRR